MRDLIARILTDGTPTRRATMRAALLAAIGGGATFLDDDLALAKPHAKRRKRRREEARARCLAACGPDCGICYYAPSGEAVCGNSVTTANCFPCETDADCGGRRCIARLQGRGGFRAVRLSTCNYPRGVCVDIESCSS